MKSNTENTIVIMAAHGGFDYNGYQSEGYKVFPAYNKISTFARIIREMWFRIPILPQTVWYHRAVLSEQPEYIIVRDPLITRKYLLWLQTAFPSARICFLYQNMVGKARHLFPDQIPEGIPIWTYDGYDSKKYGIRLKKTSCYFPMFVKEKCEKKYDLLFVGRDKGRGENLLKLKEWLIQKGFQVKFVITRDGKLSKRKKYYEEEVSYDQITRWISQSRAILNVAMENQQGITVRDLEAVFNQVKLVTTNPYIKEADFYNSDHMFVLNEGNWEQLAEFLEKPYIEDTSIDWERYSVRQMFLEITAK